MGMYDNYRNYNWLIFLVNLQLLGVSPSSVINYNWLIFLVNLQRYRLYLSFFLYYNWLIFLVNLQLLYATSRLTYYYNWLIFLVNLQPVVLAWIHLLNYNWLIFSGQPAIGEHVVLAFPPHTSLHPTQPLCCTKTFLGAVQISTFVDTYLQGLWKRTGTQKKKNFSNNLLSGTLVPVF